MGTPKGGGYSKKSNRQPWQTSALQNITSQSAPYLAQAAQGYQQFLPGGGGGKAIADQANRNFQQTTMPSIMGNFGSDSKSSSALNQALAGGAANLNTDLASMLSQLQLQAAQGLGGLGIQGQQLGQTDTFDWLQNAPPMWQQLLGPLIGAGGTMAGGYLGRPKT